ncbi:carboxylesterase family protein [Sphingomonas hengshuiensis]|uniref:carboxylesterase family protein n=1 Tax=Sphingomonas hengshuiensis TaxID=1609977 RepID=UPI000696BCAC|nr:carboxylesterase family protein [Sphingomonas hengshuiensis]
MEDGSEMTRRGAMAALAAAGLMASGGARAALAPGAQAYRAIRYARATRFGPAEMIRFEEKLIQPERGAIPPQLPSRLEISNGPQAPNRQDENCQLLSVFTPSRRGKRPVMVFLHGGAFLTGGGELPWYDGDRMAAEQDIVVVPVSHRLGAFGFWLAPGSTGMSPSYTDMLVALQWIRENIARFGGDPDNVTIAGQSAGAGAARGLTDWGHGQTLFRRIIPQSGPSFRVSREEMEDHSRKFDALLGQDPHTAPVAAVLQAQAQLTKQRGGDPGWRPVRPDTIAPFNVDILSGWAREEPAAGMWLAQGKKPVPGTPVAPLRPKALEMMGNATIALGIEAAKAGRTSYLYSFDWNGPDTGLGDCHCIDLPFLFGDRAAWQNAPMLAGVDWADQERLGRLMRAQWAAFARTGNPNVAGGPTWTPVTADSAPITSLA